jgi:hypothetical protein
MSIRTSALSTTSSLTTKVCALSSRRGIIVYFYFDAATRIFCDGSPCAASIASAVFVEFFYDVCHFENIYFLIYK